MCDGSIYSTPANSRQSIWKSIDQQASKATNNNHSDN